MLPTASEIWSESENSKLCFYRLYSMLHAQSDQVVPHEATEAPLYDMTPGTLPFRSLRDRNRKHIDEIRKKLKGTSFAFLADHLEVLRSGSGMRLRSTARTSGGKTKRAGGARMQGNTRHGGSRDPHQLGSRVITLEHIVDLLIADPHEDLRPSTGEPVKTIDLWFVLGSGHGLRSGGVRSQLGDAVNLPELAVHIADAFRAAHGQAAQVRVRTNFDIVLLPELARPSPSATEFGDGCARPHIVAVGMGSTNALVEWMVREFGDALKPAPPSPNDPRILTDERKPILNIQEHPGTGWLCATHNPLLPDRLIITCAGVDGLGTQAASWALLQYVRGLPLSKTPVPPSANRVVRGTHMPRGEVGMPLKEPTPESINWPLSLGRAVHVEA